MIKYVRNGIVLCPKLPAAASPCSDLGNLPESRWDYTVCLSESLTMMSSLSICWMLMDITVVCAIRQIWIVLQWTLRHLWGLEVSSWVQLLRSGIAGSYRSFILSNSCEVLWCLYPLHSSHPTAVCRAHLSPSADQHLLSSFITVALLEQEWGKMSLCLYLNVFDDD